MCEYKKIFPTILMLIAVLFGSSLSAKEAEEAIVYVEKQPITNFDINQVIVSSPMADSYPVMDEKDQAGLRGDILMRLINMKLLYQESLVLGLDKNTEYLKEVESYKKGYVFRKYMDKLRASIKVPEKVMDELVERLKGNTEALDAAISKYKSRQYKLVKALALGKIRDQVHLKLFADRIKKSIEQDTVLAEADNYVLKYNQLDIAKETPTNFIKSDVEKSLFKKLEVDLVYRVAEENTEDLDKILQIFASERLPSMLIAKKVKQWIPNESVAKQFFEQNPKIGYEPEKRYISQIVLANLDDANAALARIKNGESFHKLAKELTIDPVARKSAGQIGWVEENTGPPEVEEVLKTLPDEQVSNVIKTSKGYHIVIVEGRKLGIQRKYSEIYDQVHQAMIQKNMPAYIKSLQHKFKVEFAEPVEVTKKIIDS